MKMLYFEGRKGILRQYVFGALILLVCLNGLKIVSDYEAGKILPIAGNNTDMQNAYKQIYELSCGPITKETASFVTSEYQRLSDLTADGTYSHERVDGTYSGYLFGDFYLFHKYFYPYMEYSVKYPGIMRDVLQLANENVELYKRVGNSKEEARNNYILSHYADRSVREFYLYDGWEALLSYDFSDLLVLLLLILAISPIFTREKENGMTLILYSCKRGKWPLVAVKCSVSVIFACVVTLMFSIENLLIFDLVCGLDGWNSPLYAITDYQFTPFSGSILLFYVLNVGLKMIGFSMVAIVWNFLSACSKKSLYPFLGSLVACAVFGYFSGWGTSPVRWKQLLSFVSPLSLARGHSLLKNLYGVNIGGVFVLRIYALLIIQLVLVCVLVYGVWRKSCCERN